MDLVCISHLRWDFVFQRPHHLLTRAARDRRVFYIEEPVESSGAPAMACRTLESTLVVATPQLPAGVTREQRSAIQAELIANLLASHGVD